jgi:hypothetical protein
MSAIEQKERFLNCQSFANHAIIEANLVFRHTAVWAGA